MIIIISILHAGRIKYWEVKQLVQSHTAGKEQFTYLNTHLHVDGT